MLTRETVLACSWPIHLPLYPGNVSYLHEFDLGAMQVASA